MQKVLQTFISPVGFQDPGDAEFTRIKSRGPHDGPPHDVHWLDCLLDGGLVVPDGLQDWDQPPLIWLVSGPPGTGKTTFAMELCHRLAHTPQSDKRVLRSAYCSVEAPRERLLENAADLGWKLPKPDGTMTVLGSGEIGARHKGPKEFKAALFRHLRIRHKYHLIVIDSLNALPEWNRPAELMEELRTAFRKQSWFVMLLQDCPSEPSGQPDYAFVADIETRFSEHTVEGYLLQTFRIVKMRNQSHARGEHVVKCYGRPGRATPQAPASHRVGLQRQEGGIYIFPSIHRQLSGVLKSDQPPPRGSLPVPVDDMDQIMPCGREISAGNQLSGFPKGHCTAFIGDRGALKSHLAYLTMLKQLKCNPDACGLMLSLRDDEQALMETLSQIASQEPGLGGLDVASLKESHRLRIEYFWPGYIPPDEFKHRIVVATEGMIQRGKRQDGGHIIAVLNGIDHLAARHPLCAKEVMFVPALVSYLKERFVTSIVIAASDQSGPIEKSGLLPMAELVLRFEPFERPHSGAAFPAGMPKAYGQPVGVTAVRVPAGGASGRHGVLFRDPADNDRLRFVAWP